MALARQQRDALALAQERQNEYNDFPLFVNSLATPAAAARAAHLLGLWVGMPAMQIAAPSLADAQHARSMVSGGARASQRMSNFYVPFLRAAQNLPDARIVFLRGFFGAANWDALVHRQRGVFAAVNIGPHNTPWQLGYVGEPHQLALLGLEGRLRTSGWPAAAGVNAGAGAVGGSTAGQAYEWLINSGLDAATQVVEGDYIEAV